MYAHFEKLLSHCSYSVRSLDWKGGHDEGWLASGNAKGIVGLTYTSSSSASDERIDDKRGLPSRTNFNLSEHAKDVTLVRWNKSDQHHRLTTCDSTGSIVVWMPYDGRWTIELVNNRGLGTAVSQFAWSGDGSQALIAYTDGYVLVGSVHGQRLWSNFLIEGAFAGATGVRNDETKLLAAAWSPDDAHIVVANTAGELIKLDSATHNGRVGSINEIMATRLHAPPADQIVDLHWRRHPSGGNGGSKCRITVYTSHGLLAMFSRCSDPNPRLANTEVVDGCSAWSDDASLLAVGGRRKNDVSSRLVRFFSCSRLRPLFSLAVDTEYAITSLCWGLDDRRLFVAAGHEVYTATVKRGFASLQEQCRRAIAHVVNESASVVQLPLPLGLRHALERNYFRTIQGFDPKMMDPYAFASNPPPMRQRLFCTMICYLKDYHYTSRPRPVAIPTSNFTRFTLYIEYMGGLVPVLKGRRINRLKPAFVIKLVKRRQTLTNRRRVSRHTRLTESTRSYDSVVSGDPAFSSGGEDVDSPPEGGRTSPLPSNDDSLSAAAVDDDDKLPATIWSQDDEDGNPPSVVVTSNVTCTKFKIQGDGSRHLGTILYKPSLLHLHPRKITVELPNPAIDSGAAAGSDETTSIESADEDEDDEYHGERAVVSPSGSFLYPYRSGAKGSREFNDVMREEERATDARHEKVLVMYNRTPVWNSQSQVYQLDFGGRVTQESAKNFQLELDNEQVLQFGRIRTDAYTLDFQYPFSPLQAFSLAMANLTQRLK